MYGDICLRVNSILNLANGAYIEARKGHKIVESYVDSRGLLDIVLCIYISSTQPSIYVYP